MNLRSLDLNLLVILDALLDEAHVSRAASRLGLSQPAASNALQRCRRLFRDPLLERGRGEMRLTPRAEALRAPLKNLLADVVAIVDPPEVPLAELRQTVRMAMADYPASLVAAPLLAELAQSAPGVDLVVQPWRSAQAALGALVDGSSDLAVSVLPEDPAIERRLLFRERYRVFMRRDHPAADGFDLEAWLAYPHVVVSGRGEARGPLDDALAGMGLKRRVGVAAPSFMLVPQLLQGTDMIAMLPSRCAAAFPAGSVAAFEPCLEIPGFDLHIAWRARRTEDKAVRHVAALVERLLI